ncbi:MAG: SDR family NAD(P)-dependent oxidoreductase [Propionibacteriales bacterium]|nr:SDR family NAD(P)-dependent oxidoreductase [Propionibacteriales bacterium]
MAGVKGRVIAVTGAGGGIGRRHALLFAERDAKVVVNDLGGARDGTGGGSDMADDTVRAIKDAGGEAVANYDNVATSDGAAGVVQTALDAFRRIDVVVNNAGILRDRTFHKMTDEEFDAVVKVHLYGTYHVTRAAWAHMRQQQHGRVIVTTSTSGLYGNFGQSNYGAAKLGVLGMINTLALEGAKYNITANAICPIAATRMTEDIMEPGMLEELDPAYVSPAAVHLASDECTDTGTIVLAGGGLYAGVAYFQAPGHRFDHIPSPEELSEHWGAITDLKGAERGSTPL